MSATLSGQIPFTGISPTTKLPLFHVQFDSSQAGIGQARQRALIVGVTANSQPAQPVFVPSPAWAENYFGLHSQIASMIRKFRLNDQVTELWAWPATEPGGGVQAAGSFGITGTATQAGTIGFYIGGLRIPVSVKIGDTGSVVGASLEATAAIALSKPWMPGSFLTGNVPVLVSNASGTVSVTARRKGSWGNGIDLRKNWGGAAYGESDVAGLTVTVTPMSGGSAAPNIGALTASLGAHAFDFVICGLNDLGSLAVTTALMDNQTGRWSDPEQLYGHVFTSDVDTASNLLTFGANFNDPHLSVIGLNDTPTSPWDLTAAAVGGLTQALIADPARPEQTLPIAGVLTPPVGSRFLKSTRDSLLNGGIASVLARADGSMAWERCVTTYQFNASGNADGAYLDVTTPFTLMAVTRDLANFVTTTWPRAKILDDGALVRPGNVSVTPKIIKAGLVGRYSTYLRDAQNWCERPDLFAKATTVVRNAVDPTRVDVLYAPYLVSGLRIFAVLNQFRLGG